MKTFTGALIIALLTTFEGGRAFAESPSRSPTGGLVVGGLGDDDRFGFHSSTLQEGVFRGQADVARSKGIYNRLSGEGAVYAAEAGRMALDNYAQYVDTYHQTRQRAQRSGARSRAGNPPHAVALARRKGRR